MVDTTEFELVWGLPEINARLYLTWSPVSPLPLFTVPRIIAVQARLNLRY